MDRQQEKYSARVSTQKREFCGNEKDSAAAAIFDVAVDIARQIIRGNIQKALFENEATDVNVSTKTSCEDRDEDEQKREFLRVLEEILENFDREKSIMQSRDAYRNLYHGRTYNITIDYGCDMKYSQRPEELKRALHKIKAEYTEISINKQPRSIVEIRNLRMDEGVLEALHTLFHRVTIEEVPEEKKA